VTNIGNDSSSSCRNTPMGRSDTVNTNLSGSHICVDQILMLVTPNVIDLFKLEIKVEITPFNGDLDVVKLGNWSEYL
jgi:hypothetical protein